MFLIKLVSFSGSSALAPTPRFNRFDEEPILLKLHLQVLKGISIVDTPGILSGEKQRTGEKEGVGGFLMCFCEVLRQLVSQRVNSTDLLQRVGVFPGSNPNPIERNSSYSSPERFLPIQLRSILCVFSTGEPCKDRLILTAIPCRENPNSEHFF